MRRGVFVDRDGVINELVDRGGGHVMNGAKVRFTAPWKTEEFILHEKTREALQLLNDAGFACILVTNQPDLTYGTLSPEEHKKIMSIVQKLPLQDVYVCEHGRNAGCTCRKPSPAMILDAARKWNLELSSSYMLGDNEVDVSAGRNAGCTTIHISNEDSNPHQADYVANSLWSAAQLIIAKSAKIHNNAHL